MEDTKEMDVAYEIPRFGFSFGYKSSFCCVLRGENLFVIIVPGYLGTDGWRDGLFDGVEWEREGGYEDNERHN